jgi:hypothetical protein
MTAQPLELVLRPAWHSRAACRGRPVIWWFRNASMTRT